MIPWKPVTDYVEPDWQQVGTDLPPTLFWRPKKGATLGYVRDGELFDSKWLYVCDANKISHFSEVIGPEDSAVGVTAERAASA